MCLQDAYTNTKTAPIDSLTQTLQSMEKNWFTSWLRSVTSGTNVAQVFNVTVCTVTAFISHQLQWIFCLLSKHFTSFPNTKKRISLSFLFLTADKLTRLSSHAEKETIDLEGAQGRGERNILSRETRFLVFESLQ